VGQAAVRPRSLPATCARPWLGAFPALAARRWSRALALAAVAGLTLAGCAPTPAPRAPAPLSPTQRLAAVVDSILATPPFHRTHWGILVHDSETGRPLFALNPERNFVPASNMKLLTGAVALAELGEAYRYRTALEAVGALPGDTVARALVVRGRGDPTLSARFHDAPFAALDSLADSVAVRGIRRFHDGVVVDGSWFTDAPVHFAWFLGNLPSRVAAGTAAFGIEEGTVAVVLRPGQAVGDAVAVELLPYAGVADVEVRVVTGAADERRQVSTERRLPGDTLVVDGVLPLGASLDTLILAAPDPSLLAARALAGALAERGIRLDAPARVVADTAELREMLGTGPSTHLATWTSPPMSEIVPAFMLPSQNWIAEQLVKTVGAEREGDGSWAGGLEVHARYLVEGLGVDSSAFFLRDGSGLSNQSLLTPAGIIALLEDARGRPWFDTFFASLPRPGQAGGTLSGRLQGLEDRVAAKTGTVTHVNGLSGYLVADDGRALSFSILTNATGAPASAVRDAMDRIVRELATLTRTASAGGLP
jgi:serine-type D-Ala-D-Ala carboxypeptidase/endopeptidase (penicillin-binding protein 4)